MTDDGQRTSELIDHVLDHPCPECRAPAGIECGDPDTWGAGTDPTPQLEQQCPSRVAAGRLIHTALTEAVARRRMARSAGECPSWCREHVPLFEALLHGQLVGTIPTATTLGELHVLVVAQLDEPERAVALVISDREVIIGRPLAEAADVMPYLLADLIEAQRQTSSTQRPQEGGE